MKLESSATAGSRKCLIVGWVLSAIPILMMGVLGTIILLTKPDMAAGQLGHYGYPSNLSKVVFCLEIGSAIVYAVPQTSVLGAILLTGYLGGATATHLRAGESQWFMPVLVGVVAWLGIFLRDKRLRQLLFVRK